jgi:hypothetical protein
MESINGTRIFVNSSGACHVLALTHSESASLEATDARKFFTNQRFCSEATAWQPSRLG